jgi:uracil-DNA glycosylase
MNNWQDVLQAQQKQPYFQQLMSYVAQERAGDKNIYPPQQLVFNALTLTPLAQVKVVILGQDPYHGPGQAHGLAFSVLPGVKPPPSLANIYKEIVTDIDGFEIPQHGCLQSWAEQGVLLLNTVLTVEQGKAHSHAKIGWEQFTDQLIAHLNDSEQRLIFILWGSHAQRKGKMIHSHKHEVLAGPHPSPLSAYRGFFGCKHFSQTNQLLAQQGKSPIHWQV